MTAWIDCRKDKPEEYRVVIGIYNLNSKTNTYACFRIGRDFYYFNEFDCTRRDTRLDINFWIPQYPVIVLNENRKTLEEQKQSDRVKEELDRLREMSKEQPSIPEETASRMRTFLTEWKTIWDGEMGYPHWEIYSPMPESDNTNGENV